MQILYRLIAGYLAKRPALVERLIERAKRTPYTHINSRDGQREYMRRWWLFNPYDGVTRKRKHWWIPVSIRIHEIMLPDDDEHMHDHPFDAQTIILRGWYIEERDEEVERSFKSEIVTGPGWVRAMSPGDTAPVLFGDFHRIAAKSAEPVVSMFITFKERGVWGFDVDGTKVPWDEYLANRRAAEATSQTVLQAMEQRVIDVMGEAAGRDTLQGLKLHAIKSGRSYAMTLAETVTGYDSLMRRL